MKPIYSPDSHTAYQQHVVQNVLKYYPDPFVISSSSWKTINQFWLLDLSQTDLLLADRYSHFGPDPRLPSCMLRSYLLSLKFRIPSITKWVSSLKECPLNAILSGFHPDNVPGIGTFYDFLSRLWLSDSNNLAQKEQFKKKKTPKGKKKGEKTPNIKTTTSARLIRFFTNHSLPDPDTSPLALIFRLYTEQFLQNSVNQGLINPDSLALAGDGTPVVTSARPRYKKICACKEKHCRCKRKFSQPDCNIGWDSSRDRYFNGYHLYMFVASDSHSDLPVFPLLQRASRHDMPAFLHTFFTMKSWMPKFNVEKLLLDSAHDSDAVYRYCNSVGIQPFIDLNSRSEGKHLYNDTFYLDDSGTPVCCRTDKKFISDGVEPNRKRRKWRCPLAGKKGCKCETPCSESKYGRTVHTHVKDDPRLINEPPRDSKDWNREYGRRTSVERSNKREKDDYKLEDGRHRSTKMWYCRLYGIMMLQHLDAWKTPTLGDFQIDFVKRIA